MEKIKNLEKALNDIGIQTTLEQIEGCFKNQVYHILVLELTNTCDGDLEPYSFIFHPTTYQLINDITQGEKIGNYNKKRLTK